MVAIVGGGGYSGGSYAFPRTSDVLVTLETSSLFADDFESGDLGAWSGGVP